MRSLSPSFLLKVLFHQHRFCAAQAEKMRLKKQKAQAYETGKQRGKLSKNAGRWK